MTRQKTIHRSDVLDAAEAVVRDNGVQRFTLDAVAEQAGISKGGLVYSFNTKDDLIEAMLAREFNRFGAEASDRAGKVEGAGNRKLLGHMAAILSEDESIAVEAASLLTALVHAPGRLEPARAYYREMLASFEIGTERGDRERLAFLAIEGMFLLRGMGLIDATTKDWLDVVSDARDLLSRQT